MSLVELVLAAILSVPRADADRARLSAVANDVATVATEAPFGSKEATALALVAIAQHESGFAADVQTCRRNGDGGRSVSLWQLQGPWAWDGHTRAEVCASPELAATLALGVLSRHARCGTYGGMFRGYASGSCATKSDAGEALCRSWVRLLGRAGYSATCDGAKGVKST